MGLISWLCADIVLTYYYFGLGIKEHPVASIADAFWFFGYGLLSAHLVMALRSIPVRFDNKKIALSLSYHLLFRFHFSFIQ